MRYGTRKNVQLHQSAEERAEADHPVRPLRKHRPSVKGTTTQNRRRRGYARSLNGGRNPGRSVGEQRDQNDILEAAEGRRGRSGSQPQVPEPISPRKERLYSHVKRGVQGRSLKALGAVVEEQQEVIV